MNIGRPEARPFIEETKLWPVTASRIYEGAAIDGEPADLTALVKDGYLTADIREGRPYGADDEMKETTMLPKTADGRTSVTLKPYPSEILCSDPENAAEPEKEYARKGTVSFDGFSLTLKPAGPKEEIDIENSG